ncbi:MAG: hypothetical protein LW750_06640 [Bacteroidetes bacterium]|nr:hypothetical protein [Bacteroidota bacterium]
MNINRHNYEAWLLDYIEGSLSAEQVDELLVFLDANPELKATLDDYRNISFETGEEIRFDAKEVLKKSNDVINNEPAAPLELMIAVMEGTCTAEELKMWERAVENNPKLEQEFHLLQPTRLSPDLSVVLEDKEMLKRNAETITIANYEEWMIAAFEGTLRAEQLEQWNAFVAQHPEIQQEYEALQQTKLVADDVVFEHKTALKRTAPDVNRFEELVLGALDQTLTNAEQAEWKMLLQLYPHLQVELEQLRQTVVQPDTTIVFADKVSLKRPAFTINSENIDVVCMQAAEGTLSVMEQQTLNEYLKVHPEYAALISAYRNTIVTPDVTVVFEDKKSLYRKERGAWFWLPGVQWSAAAAVAILITIGLWNIGSEELNNNGNGFAINNNSNVPGTKPNNTNSGNTSGSPIANVDNRTVAGGAKPILIAGLNTTIITPVAAKSENWNTIEPSVVRLSSKDINPTAPEFSDAFYNTLNQSAPASNDNAAISAGQYAMQWMKSKLDRRPNVDPELVEEVLVANNGTRVDGWDLAMSAVNRVGSATGGKLQMNREIDDVVVHVGKYELRFGAK